MPDGFSTTPVGTGIQPCPLKEQKKPQHWVEIELVGEDGKPIPWELYSVVLPTGQTVAGYLDNKGYARIGSIEKPGTCKISFPNLDKDAFEFIESAGPRDG